MSSWYEDRWFEENAMVNGGIIRITLVQQWTSKYDTVDTKRVPTDHVLPNGDASVNLIGVSYEPCCIILDSFQLINKLQT